MSGEESFGLGIKEGVLGIGFHEPAFAGFAIVEKAVADVRVKAVRQVCSEELLKARRESEE